MDSKKVQKIRVCNLMYIYIYFFFKKKAPRVHINTYLLNYVNTNFASFNPFNSLLTHVKPVSRALTNNGPTLHTIFCQLLS